MIPVTIAPLFVVVCIGNTGHAKCSDKSASVQKSAYGLRKEEAAYSPTALRSDGRQPGSYLLANRDSRKAAARVRLASAKSPSLFRPQIGNDKPVFSEVTCSSGASHGQLSDSA